MAWVDSMRLRRRADLLRRLGWVNLFLTVIWLVVHASDGLPVFALGFIWAAGVLGVTYGIGWALDKRADRVVRH